MTSSAGAASPVRWMIRPVSVGGMTLAVARLEVHLHLAADPASASIAIEPAWFDTGAPVSVIPFHVQQNGLAPRLSSE